MGKDKRGRVKKGGEGRGGLGKGRRKGEGRDWRGEIGRGGGRVSPKLKFASPQNYFPGAGAGL